VTLGIAAAIVFGYQTWPAFIDALGDRASSVSEDRLAAIPLVSIFGFLSSVGVSSYVGWTVQLSVSAIVAARVCVLWARPIPYSLKAASLAIGSVIISPHTIGYDVCILSIGVALLVKDGLSRGFLRRERAVLLMCWAGLILLAGPFPAIICIVLLALVARRAAWLPGGRVTVISGVQATAELETAPTLSVVIPVYNEARTIGRVVLQVAGVLPGVRKQIIIIDDCSSDGTSQWLRRNLARAEGVWHGIALDGDGELCLSPEGAQDDAGFSFTILFHDHNRGKGAALKTGFARAAGEVIVIQDADLEYDPHEWSQMLPLILDRKVADVVYGSRFYGRPHRSIYYHHYMGNRLISLLFNVLYNQTLTDIEVCYKMFKREVLQELRLTSDDFGFEIEISAQIALARHWRIYEVGISYFGRTYDEGKKIDWRDGIKALLYLFKFRLSLINYRRRSLRNARDSSPIPSAGRRRNRLRARL
jgi:glycosyltransferase involved in cell wall biosynthesis